MYLLIKNIYLMKTSIKIRDTGYFNEYPYSCHHVQEVITWQNNLWSRFMTDRLHPMMAPFGLAANGDGAAATTFIPRAIGIMAKGGTLLCTRLVGAFRPWLQVAQRALEIESRQLSVSSWQL